MPDPNLVPAGSDVTEVSVIVWGDPRADWTASLRSVVSPHVRGLQVLLAGVPTPTPGGLPADLRVEVLPPAATRDASLEKAVRRASGAFIAFLEVPDRWHADLLTQLVALLRPSPALDLVFAQALFEPHPNPRLNRPYPMPERLADLLGTLLEGIPVPLSAVVVRRSAVDRLGLPDRSVNRRWDRDFLLRFAASGACQGVPKPVVTRMPSASENSGAAREHEEEAILRAAAARLAGTGPGRRIAVAWARRVYRRARWEEARGDRARAGALYREIRRARDGSPFNRRAFGHGLLLHLPGWLRHNRWWANRVTQMRLWADALVRPGADSLKQSLVGEVAGYFGWPEERAEVFCRQATDGLARAWDQAKPETPEQLTAFYDEAAIEYIGDLMYWHSLEVPGSGPLNYVTALRRALRQGGRAYLDFGGGVGSGALLFARHHFEITLADISSVLLDFARWRFKARGLAARWVDLKTQSLPLEAFDCVTAFDVLEHLADPGATLRSLFTHLRRGGLLFANLPEVDEAHPMHYRHEPRVLLAEARRLGFRVLRSRAGSPWVLEKPD